MDIFLLASRAKLRFDTPAGSLSSEDLWDLPLTTTRRNAPSLDDIAIALDQQIKTVGETTSFVRKTTKVNETLKLKFAVVKAIIDIRLEEQDAAETKAANDDKKRRILEIIAHKQDEELAGKSVDELKELVNAL